MEKMVVLKMRKKRLNYIFKLPNRVMLLRKNV